MGKTGVYVNEPQFVIPIQTCLTKFFSIIVPNYLADMRAIEPPGRLTFFRLPDEIVMPKFFTTVYVKGGFPSPAQDFIEEDIDLVAFLGMDKPSTFVARIGDNFPIEENLPANAYLIVNKEIPPVSQDMVLGLLDGEYVVKTMVKSARGWTLYSRNPHISPIIIREGDNFSLLGVVTQLIIDRAITKPQKKSAHSIVEEIDLFILLGVNKPSVFIARTDGHSMEDKNIPNGSYLMVDRSITPKAHDVVIACLNTEFTLKTLVSSADKWILYPGNPHYPPIPIQAEDDFMVWGVVSKVIIDRPGLWKRFQ